MKAVFQLLRINWKETLRSPIWHRKALVNVFLVLMFLYLGGNLLALGIVLDNILMSISVDGIDYKTYGSSWVLRRLNQYLLYYFFADFILRYFMQKLPTMAIQPLLHLPIRRSSIAHLMLVKSVFSPFNWIHLLLLFPFVLELFGNLPFSQAFGWTLGMMGTVLLMNYILLYIKRKAEVSTWSYIGLVSAFVLILMLDWFDWVDFNVVSSAIFNPLFLYPWLAVFVLVCTAGAYMINLRFLIKNMYMSRISKTKASEVDYVGDGLLSKLGLVGKLAELELKLIWRNKRPRSVLLITLLFLGYGLFVFPNPEFQGNYMMYMMFSIIITGMFILNYGQYLMGWDGAYFDHILTRSTTLETYYHSKFIVFALVSTVSMILAIPYVYFGWEILGMLFSVFLFNIGINSFIVMFFGSFNPKKIDLSKGTVFNWQGVGAAQFLLAFPVFGFPVGIYFVSLLFTSEVGAMLILGGVGLIGLAGTKLWIRLLASWLRSQRYEIASDFRNT